VNCGVKFTLRCGVKLFGVSRRLGCSAGGSSSGRDVSCKLVWRQQQQRELLFECWLRALRAACAAAAAVLAAVHVSCSDGGGLVAGGCQLRTCCV
jgi:hypothetical protein